MRSLSIVFPEKQRVEIREEQVDDPRSGELLCVAQKSLISIGTEANCFRGEFDPGTNWELWVRYPFFPGYSMSAKVLEVGKGVRDYREGDRIAAAIPHRQYFTIPQDRAQPIPDEVTDDEACWSSLANTTQLGVRRAQLQLGEIVGVIGLGMLGQLVTQYLHLSGARRILAIDPSSFRLEIAKSHGAHEILAMKVQDCRFAIENLTRGLMLDIVFDITGHPAVLSACIPLLRKMGRLVLLGDTPTPTQQYLGPGIVSDSISILGIHGTMVPTYASVFNPWTASEMTRLFFEYLQQGRMRVLDLITHRFSPLDAAEVYPQLEEHRLEMIGVIFDWEQVAL